VPGDINNDIKENLISGNRRGGGTFSSIPGILTAGASPSRNIPGCYAFWMRADLRGGQQISVVFRPAVVFLRRNRK